MTRAAVVVPAGGSGRRMGGVRKQFLELAGEPVLAHALRPFLAHPAVEWVVVALPESDLAEPPAWLTGLDPRVRLVAGGAERGDSVRHGLEAVPDEADVVLVHDAALVERYGGEVVVVEGSPDNLKVTTPVDIVVAEALLEARNGVA